MDILLTLVTALLLFAQGPIYKLYNAKCVSVGKTNDFLLNMFNFGAGLLVLGLPAFLNKTVDFNALLWGVGNGVLFCSMLVFYNKSLQLGKIAFVNFIMAMAMIIPLFGGMILFDETVSLIQWIALGVLILASYLVSFGQKEKNHAENEDKEKSKKNKIKLWIFVILGMITNGGLSLFIKVAYNLNAGIDQMQFLFSSYFTSFTAMTVLTAFTTKGFTRAREYMPNKWFPILGLTIGVVTVFGNMAFTFFSVVTPAALFYPVTGVLPMLLAALISPLLKEKLSKISICGIILGAVAIVMLNL